MDQYVSVGVYMIGMIILFGGVYLFSSWLENKMFSNKNKIYKSKKKNNKEKKWFYDVA
jgi:hypothetical protein